jgi:hypothetical protein
MTNDEYRWRGSGQGRRDGMNRIDGMNEMSEEE